MESLRHICAKTETAFKEFYSGMEIGKLEKVAGDWLNGNEKLEIVGFSIKPGDCLRIIFKRQYHTSNLNNYNLIRLLPGGKENWNVSVDLDSVTEERLLEYLLKNQK